MPQEKVRWFGDVSLLGMGALGLDYLFGTFRLGTIRQCTPRKALYGTSVFKHYKICSFLSIPNFLGSVYMYDYITYAVLVLSIT
jgi:hypothetical protein